MADSGVAGLSAVDNSDQNIIEVYPSLVVGIGGTGCKVAKRLKKTVMAEGSSELRICFVGIDTELAEQEARDSAEARLDFFMPIAGGEMHYDPNDKTNAPIEHWLPTEDAARKAIDASNLVDGDGAHGERLSGRVAFNYFAPDFKLDLQRKVDGLLDIGANPFTFKDVRYKYRRGLAVYVICSLAGGTGSGAFLDAIAMLHQVTKEPLRNQRVRFHGILALPSVYQYEGAPIQTFTHKATTYACLKDLDLLMNTADRDMRSFWFYNDPKPFELTGSLFDVVHLVGRYNGTGSLQSPADVFDLIATQLYCYIGTPFGSSCSAIDSNCRIIGAIDAAGGRRHYSSFGLVGVDFSRRLLVRYCSARAGQNAIDAILGTPPSLGEAQASAESFLRDNGFVTDGDGSIIDLITADAQAIHRENPEDHENDRVENLASELVEANTRLDQSVSGGELYNQLSRNKSLHLSQPPGQRSDRDDPGPFGHKAAKGWAATLQRYVDDIARDEGIESARIRSGALKTALERFKGELDVRERDLSGAATSSKQSLDSRINELTALSGFSSFVHRGEAREKRRAAVRQFNEHADAKARLRACQLAGDVLNQPGEGLIARLGGMITKLNEAAEQLNSVRSNLSEMSTEIEQGSEAEARLAGAPERSVLLYDIISPSAFRNIFASEPAYHLQIKDKILQIATSTTKAAAADNEPAKRVKELSEAILQEGESLYKDIAGKHILDLLAGGATDQMARRAAFHTNIAAAAKNLGPFAQAAHRMGLDQDYEYCIVAYPNHPDPKLVRDFMAAATSAIREVRQRATVSFSPCHGPTNRLIMTLMQHGYALNNSALPELDTWRAAYLELLKRNPKLDVDKRWMKVPGPGMENTGDRREKLFALGIAYGLIAQRGDYFYVNFHKNLFRRDPSAAGTGEEYEVDLEKLADALETAGKPIEWFKHITRSASEANTIPAAQGVALGSADNLQPRDRVAQGRAAAMNSFAKDVTENYEDVADAIEEVMEEYLENAGKLNILTELRQYKDELEKPKSAIKEQLERESNLLDTVLESIERHGTLGL